MVALVAITMVPSASRAQDLEAELVAGEALSTAAGASRTPRSCVQALPASAFRRTMVFITADDAGAPFAPVPENSLLAVRLATESIAWHARALLGAPEGLLPPPDTVVNWRNVGRHLHLVGHRDGTITWSYPWETPGHRPLRDSIGEPTLALLASAVDRALARGERFAWDPGMMGDSVPFLLRLDYPDLDDKGKLEPLRGQYAAMLVEMRVPTITPVSPRKQGRIDYPEDLRRRGVTGTLVLQFIVDSSGVPVQESIRDLSPQSRPRLKGELARHYNNFLREVRFGLRQSRYNPARVGTCAVNQLVQQPFIFDIQR